MDIVFVVAIAENGVIGRDNALPWRLKSDLRRFRALTYGKPVVMGRKTFTSIGKPLAGRTNIVVSRSLDFAARGVVAAVGIDAALETARADALRRGVHEIVIIGGADIFTALMPRATRLEVTRVHAAPEGDVRFHFDPAQWREEARSELAAGPEDSAAVSFVTYGRA